MTTKNKATIILYSSILFDGFCIVFDFDLFWCFIALLSDAEIIEYAATHHQGK